MGLYSSGKHAKAQCDRCGFVVPYRDLAPEVYDGKFNGLRVCPECLDRDQPQLRLRDVRVDDAQALREPRPFQGIEISPTDPVDVG